MQLSAALKALSLASAILPETTQIFCFLTVDVFARNLHLSRHQPIVNADTGHNVAALLRVPSLSSTAKQCWRARTQDTWNAKGASRRNEIR